MYRAENRVMLMQMRTSPPSRDRQLVQIVDAALANAARKSGNWLVCRPGCTQCCVGVFPINQLDAARLRQGLRDLQQKDPVRAARVLRRAQDAVARLSPDFPGDARTGLLDQSADGQERFSDFADDEPCPALDFESGLCDLYESRPMTCRVFGPPIRSEEGLGVCELCFQGASDQEIAACEMVPDPDGLEDQILRSMEKKSGESGETIVAFCLVS
jgi:Fe-S-cluster containining protein